MLVRPSSRYLQPCNHVQRRYASINYLVAALAQNKAKFPEISPVKNSSKSKPIAKELPPKNLLRLVITPSALTEHFRQAEYTNFSVQQISEAQSFFNRAKVSLEWTLADYEEIPDIKYERLLEKRITSLNEIDPYYKTKYHESMLNSKKTFGIQPELLRPLPEVLLLGHTNVGKSSLLNNLIVNSDASEYAYVSQRAGYTKTINCYNIGRKLRVIDSPGYGQFGEAKQGKVVLDYISKRHLLRRVFILIDSVEGFRVEDMQMMDHLISEGVPFEVVFTKTDAVIGKYMPKKGIFNSQNNKKSDPQKRAEMSDMIAKSNEQVIAYYTRIIHEAKLHEVVTVPRLLFNNAATNRYIDKTHGFKEVRTTIMESCGLLK